MPTETRCADEWLVRLLTNKGLLNTSLAAGLADGDSPYASSELLRRGTISKAQLAETIIRQELDRLVKERQGQ